MDKIRGNRQRAENRAAVAVKPYARVYRQGFQLIDILYNPCSRYAHADDETLKRENSENSETGATTTKIWYSSILKQDKTTWGNRIWYKSDFCLFSVPAQIRKSLTPTVWGDRRKGGRVQ
jgi:hypothetical protein